MCLSGIRHSGMKKMFQDLTLSSLVDIYSVIQKDGLNFVRLYFLKYTWYVNELQNI